MANNQFNNRMEYQQRESSGVSFHNAGFGLQLIDFKRSIKMAQAKMIWIICDILGIPITILGIVANIDNIKSAILAVLGIAYLMLRGYFYFVQKTQSVREKELDLWHKQMDKLERMDKMKIPQKPPRKP